MQSRPCCIAAMGNFDGVHMGHAALLQKTRERAARLMCTSLAITFDPHTRLAITPSTDLSLLSLPDEKELLLEQIGVDQVAHLPFDETITSLTAAEFVKQVLVQQYNVVELVLGPNQTFGCDRRNLQNFLPNEHGINHFTIFPFENLIGDDGTISSTRIRLAIQTGNIAHAVRMLGHPYLILAQRVAGEKIGTQLGFPTLNFKTPPSIKLIPPPGIYAAELEYASQIWQGALYFGNCPTFSNRNFRFEFNAFAANGRFPQTGELASLRVHEFIRFDEKFIDTQKLVMQIERDVETVKNFFIQEKGYAPYKGVQGDDC